MWCSHAIPSSCSATPVRRTARPTQLPVSHANGSRPDPLPDEQAQQRQARPAGAPTCAPPPPPRPAGPRVLPRHAGSRPGGTPPRTGPHLTARRPPSRRPGPAAPGPGGRASARRAVGHITARAASQPRPAGREWVPARLRPTPGPRPSAGPRRARRPARRAARGSGAGAAVAVGPATPSTQPVGAARAGTRRSRTGGSEQEHGTRGCQGRAEHQGLPAHRWPPRRSASLGEAASRTQGALRGAPVRAAPRSRRHPGSPPRARRPRGSRPAARARCTTTSSPAPACAWTPARVIPAARARADQAVGHRGRAVGVHRAAAALVAGVHRGQEVDHLGARAPRRPRAGPAASAAPGGPASASGSRPAPSRLAGRASRLTTCGWSGSQLAGVLDHHDPLAGRGPAPAAPRARRSCRCRCPR